MNMQEKKEEIFKIKGEELLQKVKNLFKEGNIRKIAINDKNGRTIAEFPLTIGVAGALVTPVLVAVGSIAALISECSIVVYKDSKR